MAYTSNTTHTFSESVASAFFTIGQSISAFFADLINARTRAEFMKELQAMDDVTLQATHGITRNEIVAYVFQDRLVP